ncbi:MAG: hypothetical protein PGN37_16670 [Mycobacterium kyogaense]|uniref:hypothetical protein n=1 Tax=Mycobacterium kyogaense TaxID=2212479 RepID=UPI002FF77EB4
MVDKVPDTPVLPPLDHLQQASVRARATLRYKGGVPPELKADRRYLWGYVHLTRLVDKAIREYNAAREAGRLFGVQKIEGGSLDMVPYLLRACDHLENCVDATHRAVEALQALRAAGVGTRSPEPNAESVRRIQEIRHAVQHTSHRLIDTDSLNKKRRPFGPQDPYGIAPQKDHLAIGAEDPLAYVDLVELIETCYKAAELIGDRAARSYLLVDRE